MIKNMQDHADQKGGGHTIVCFNLFKGEPCSLLSFLKVKV